MDPIKKPAVKTFNYICLKTARWSSWPLLLAILCSLFTGYMISGEFGLDALLDEKQARAMHKLLHVPLVGLLAVHVFSAGYLGLRRLVLHQNDGVADP